MKKLTCLSAFLCMLYTGCAQDTSKPETAKPFDLEEPEVTQSPDPGPTEPRREFAPGELAWAKPDHRVVVHFIEEADAAKKTHKPYYKNHKK